MLKALKLQTQKKLVVSLRLEVLLIVGRAATSSRGDKGPSAFSLCCKPGQVVFKKMNTANAEARDGDVRNIGPVGEFEDFKDGRSVSCR